MTTGKDLQLRRVAMDVTTSALAERVGVPSSTISRWEAARVLKDKAARRYLEGLATFGTIPTVVVTPDAASEVA